MVIVSHNNNSLQQTSVDQKSAKHAMAPICSILDLFCAVTCLNECLWYGSLWSLEHRAVCLSPEGETGTAKDQTLMFSQLTWFDKVTELHIEVEPQASKQRPFSLRQNLLCWAGNVWHLRKHFIYCTILYKRFSYRGVCYQDSAARAATKRLF